MQPSAAVDGASPRRRSMVNRKRASRGELFPNRAVRSLRSIGLIKRQCRAAGAVGVGTDPGVLVGESPHLDRGASRTFQTRSCNAAIYIALPSQVVHKSQAIGLHRERDVQLSDVNLQTE